MQKICISILCVRQINTLKLQITSIEAIRADVLVLKVFCLQTICITGEVSIINSVFRGSTARVANSRSR